MTTTGRVNGIISNIVIVKADGAVGQNEICYVYAGDTKICLLYTSDAADE